MRFAKQARVYKRPIVKSMRDCALALIRKAHCVGIIIFLFFKLIGVLDTNTSPQGSGKKVMSKGYVKVGANGPNGSNGNGSVAVMEVSKSETATVEEAETEVVVEKVEAVEEVKPKADVAPVVTLERKMEKVEELNITIEKWQKLQTARKGLANFRLGSDGLSSTLELKDADGKPFKTSNPVVVEAAVAHIRQVLNEKIKEAEADINFNV